MTMAARKAGLSPSSVSLIVSGKRRASADAAKRLEQATGIGREAWLYPDEHVERLRTAFVEVPFGAPPRPTPVAPAAPATPVAPRPLQVVGR